MINKRAQSKYLNDDLELMIRCSSLANIMASPTNCALPDGAKTYVKKVFKEIYLNYSEKEVSLNAFNKGNLVEDEAINLLNIKFDSFYFKNQLSKSNGYIKGTCDILVPKKYIRDTKCPLSKETFPIEDSDAQNTTYEWQLRGYMWLYDVPKAYLDYCLITTPVELRAPWDMPSVHEMDDLSLDLRHYGIMYERDLEKEKQIINRINACRVYFEQLKTKFNVF